MATITPDDFADHWIVRFLPMQTLKDAQNLFHRFREGKAFRFYLRDRLRLVLPAVLLIVLIGVTCAAAFVVVVTGVSSWLGLPAILLMPVILLGSLFVQAYVFFAWLENRALAKSLGKRARQRQSVAAGASRKFDLDLGQPPPIPWLLVALFFVAPLAMLASFAPGVAAALAAAAIALPLAYAKLDR